LTAIQGDTYSYNLALANSTSLFHISHAWPGTMLSQICYAIETWWQTGVLDVTKR